MFEFANILSQDNKICMDGCIYNGKEEGGDVVIVASQKEIKNIYVLFKQPSCFVFEDNYGHRYKAVIVEIVKHSTEHEKILRFKIKPCVTR